MTDTETERKLRQGITDLADDFEAGRVESDDAMLAALRMLVQP